MLVGCIAHARRPDELVLVLIDAGGGEGCIAFVRSLFTGLGVLTSHSRCDAVSSSGVETKAPGILFVGDGGSRRELLGNSVFGGGMDKRQCWVNMSPMF
ncbi:hypothetical protein LTR16_000256 [Cryomyces antarcticus]|uniref:Uncharacterized protein n=1 Tax=Cryomyces antarcticus TaxID=329879 RepID=A0ABR0MB06_9PEZI|nr:hypothetical protein LTR16_000256 [Cryomyces antarcticus]